MTEDELFRAYGLPEYGPPKPSPQPQPIVVLLVVLEVAQGGADDAQLMTEPMTMTDTTDDRWVH